MKKYALVYQAGIANVFEVVEHSKSTGGRVGTKRMLQHAFLPCEYFCRGLKAAGGVVAVYSCNRAGDIKDEVWKLGLQDCPFADAARPDSSFINS